MKPRLLPVRKGQLLGYQGWRSGAGRGRIWLHLHFAVAPALEDGSFPDETMERVIEGEPLPKGVALEFPPAPSPYMGTIRSQHGWTTVWRNRRVLDPSPYLGTIRSQVMGTPDWLPWRCQENTTTNLE